MPLSRLKEKTKLKKLKMAVKRMLLWTISKKQLTKLKIYNGEKHPHDTKT